MRGTLLMSPAARQIVQGACALCKSSLHLPAGCRWYAGAVVLQDGRIFVAGGSHGEGGGYVSPITMFLPSLLHVLTYQALAV